MDAELEAALAETQARRDALAADQGRRDAADHARATTLETAKELQAAELLAVRDRLGAAQKLVEEMREQRRVVLSGRQRALKIIQALVRGTLVTAAGVGFLFLSLTEVPGLMVGGLLLASLAAAWFLGDLADYMELDR